MTCPDSPTPLARETPHRSIAAAGAAGERSSNPGGDDRFRAIFNQALDAQILFDDEGRCVEVNGAAAALVGVPASEMVGQPVDRFMGLPPTEDLPAGCALWAGLVDPGHQFRECVILRPDSETRAASCRVSPNILPGLHLCQMQDITNRKQVEQIYRALVDVTNTGYSVADAEGRILDANTEYVRLSGHDSLDQILGRRFIEWIVPTDRERCAAQLASRATNTSVRHQEVDYIGREPGTVQPVEVHSSAILTNDGMRVVALCRDITERRDAQAALESRVRARTAELARANAEIRSRSHRQEIVANFGHRALMGASADALMREAVDLVARTLGADLCEVLEWKPVAPQLADSPSAPDDMLMRAGYGWPVELLDRRVSSSRPDTLEGYTLRAHQPVVFEDLAAEERFDIPDGLRELGVVSGISLIIDGETRPFGVLGAHCRTRRAFSDDDVFFVQTMANTLAEVIERQRGEDAIRAAQREVTRANNAKNDFLSRMSHELRTPLNAILGFGQLLEIEDLAESQRESVDQIIRAGRHLLEMVNEVLDIARIESGSLALSLESVSLRQLVREAVDLTRPLANGRGIELVLAPSLDESPLYVLADRQRLRQVLLNLLSNGVKFNRDRGRVELSVAPQNWSHERLRLEVADTGVGISADKASRLFTPFERLGAEKTGVEGDGIGLALSKCLMDAQGGALGFEPRDGEGSTFWIELPYADEPAADELPLDLLHTLLEDSRPTEAALSRDQPQTVLHIEDNESNRLLVELLFVQRPSLHLLSAARGQEGLQLARDRHPDLILLDMHLPDTPGEEVLHSLRTDDRTRGTPVVVISADASGPRIRHLREAGADDYLTKPFNVGQFLRMLDEHLVH